MGHHSGELGVASRRGTNDQRGTHLIASDETRFCRKKFAYNVTFLGKIFHFLFFIDYLFPLSIEKFKYDDLNWISKLNFDREKYSSYFGQVSTYLYQRFWIKYQYIYIDFIARYYEFKTKFILWRKMFSILELCKQSGPQMDIRHQ